MKINFMNSYASLGDSFSQSVNPSSAVDPKLILFNHELAGLLGIDSEGVAEEELASIFSGKKVLETSHPLAMAPCWSPVWSFCPPVGRWSRSSFGGARGAWSKEV